ncbi:nucleotide sugar dehydrogenase [bacterium]|nr:nucleotide sugar dehydrogenase [candidate division CSSED10-310 bacterium]
MNGDADTLQVLINRFKTHQAKIGVIGLGYVGLPLAIEMVRSGYEVIGIDVDSGRVDSINQGRSYVMDVPHQVLRQAVQSGRLRATDSYSMVTGLDAVSICVPTPLRKTKDPDISYIVSAINNIAAHKRRGQLIILESTTYPGTTEEILLPELQRDGAAVGVDFFLAFSPERVDPGNRRFTTRNTPKIIGGVTPACSKAAEALYSQFIDQVITVSSPRAAEMVKLLENTFRSVNIAMVNEMALMCDRLGLDVWEIIDAAATKPFGFMPFYPGPGLGGHCIPIDPHYLSWKLKSLNYQARFIDLASTINSHMPHHVMLKLTDALNDRGHCLRGSRILIIGIAYKKDINDLRESPALDLMKLLHDRGAILRYYDPFIPDLDLDWSGEHLHSVDITTDTLSSYTAGVIVTDHSTYDYHLMADSLPLLLDTRNATRGLRGEYPNIVRL